MSVLLNMFLLLLLLSNGLIAKSPNITTDDIRQIIQSTNNNTNTNISISKLNLTDNLTVNDDRFSPFPEIIANWLDQKHDNDQCSKGDLTNRFALALQGVLGIVSFGVLILKRTCEDPENRRTWSVWFLDTSKQGLGMMFMHVINVFTSETNQNNVDPCTFYLTSFILDSTIGLLIIWIVTKFSEFMIIKYKILGGLPFGEYERYSYEIPTTTTTMNNSVYRNVRRNSDNQINRPAQENMSFTQNDENDQESVGLVRNNSNNNNGGDADSEILDAAESGQVGNHGDSIQNVNSSKPQSNFQTPIFWGFEIFKFFCHNLCI